MLRFLILFLALASCLPSSQLLVNGQGGEGTEVGPSDTTLSSGNLPETGNDNLQETGSDNLQETGNPPPVTSNTGRGRRLFSPKTWMSGRRKPKSSNPPPGTESGQTDGDTTDVNSNVEPTTLEDTTPVTEEVPSSGRRRRFPYIGRGSRGNVGNPPLDTVDESSETNDETTTVDELTEPVPPPRRGNSWWRDTFRRSRNRDNPPPAVVDPNTGVEEPDEPNPLDGDVPTGTNDEEPPAGPQTRPRRGRWGALGRCFGGICGDREREIESESDDVASSVSNPTSEQFDGRLQDPNALSSPEGSVGGSPSRGSGGGRRRLWPFGRSRTRGGPIPVTGGGQDDEVMDDPTTPLPNDNPPPDMVDPNTVDDDQTLVPDDTLPTGPSVDETDAGSQTRPRRSRFGLGSFGSCFGVGCRRRRPAPEEDEEPFTIDITSDIQDKRLNFDPAEPVEPPTKQDWPWKDWKGNTAGRRELSYRAWRRSVSSDVDHNILEIQVSGDTGLYVEFVGTPNEARNHP
ncbi:hypothetical protein CTA1_5348 [Colletotrichum tanaceti]|uniref:Uncharacterized protein n=1 Tax=Colletotrichum tanaceti TaxID=1306861 RepID=A0A4U6XH35_9PEZI|nr:hypothetical protein CTA1_5348 [Colletotrichum tanaceti]